MADLKGKIALITGATSGIGLACAQRLAQEGLQLILCGRRQDRLKKLAKDLGKKTSCHALAFDVADPTAVAKAISSLPKKFCAIDILINNAGNAHGLEPIQGASTEDIYAMVDINIKGLLAVTKAVLPAMVEKQSGHIINLGSIAAKENYPNGTVYCASKAAVDSLTRGMRIDLLSQGIKVSAMHPGLVNTEFALVRFKGDKKKADAVYQGMTPLVAEDIADVIWYMLAAPKHINIADILVLPTEQASCRDVKRK